jgi:hypothetical protein
MQRSFEPRPSSASEDVIVLCGGNAVLGQGGVDPILQGRAELESAIHVRWSSFSSGISLGCSQTVGRLSRWSSLAKRLPSS